MASDSKIERKLDYLQNTKSLIQQAMSNKGITVDSSVSFRDYANLINNLKIEKDQSDATVLPNDMVAGKIAYNNNEKVVGTLSEYSSLSSEATEVTDDSVNEKVTGSIQLDSRTLLGKNAKVNVDINYSDIDEFSNANAILDDILGK